jgi:hypothetical protein
MGVVEGPQCDRVAAALVVHRRTSHELTEATDGADYAELAVKRAASLAADRQRVTDAHLAWMRARCRLSAAGDGDVLLHAAEEQAHAARLKAVAECDAAQSVAAYAQMVACVQSADRRDEAQVAHTAAIERRHAALCGEICPLTRTQSASRQTLTHSLGRVQRCGPTSTSACVVQRHRGPTSDPTAAERSKLRSPRLFSQTSSK